MYPTNSLPENTLFPILVIDKDKIWEGRKFNSEKIQEDRREVIFFVMKNFGLSAQDHRKINKKMKNLTLEEYITTKNKIKSEIDEKKIALFNMTLLFYSCNNLDVLTIALTEIRSDPLYKHIDEVFNSFITSKASITQLNKCKLLLKIDQTININLVDHQSKTSLHKALNYNLDDSFIKFLVKSGGVVAYNDYNEAEKQDRVNRIMQPIILKTNKKMNAMFEFFRCINYFLDDHLPEELKSIICAKAINLPLKVIEKILNINKSILI